MKKDRILNNSLNVIRKYLKEEGPTMSMGAGPTNKVGDVPDKPIAGLNVNPPVRKKPPEMFRRTRSVQTNQSRGYPSSNT